MMGYLAGRVIPARAYRRKRLRVHIGGAVRILADRKL